MSLAASPHALLSEVWDDAIRHMDWLGFGIHSNLEKAKASKKEGLKALEKLGFCFPSSFNCDYGRLLDLVRSDLPEGTLDAVNCILRYCNCHEALGKLNRAYHA